MALSSITRAALGSSASLGDLYDARRDDFCGINVFKKNIPDSAQTLIDSHFSDIHLVHSDDFSEKTSKLDVSAELQVSVLAGLFKLSGSGKYLSDKKKSARTVKSSLIYNIKTKEESVNVYHEDLKDAFSIDAIESGVATHVVTTISWGANSMLSCLYENRENRDVTEIGGMLSAQLTKASLQISGKASVDFKEGDNSTGVKFDVRVFGDVLPRGEELPTTFEGALDFMKKMPGLVDKSNEGKGKPLSYRLIPISLLKSYLNFSLKVDILLTRLEEASTIRVVQLFDKMAVTQQQFNDFYQDVIDFKYCVPPEDLIEISKLKEEMSVQEASFRSELSRVLIQVRSGNTDVDALEDLLKKFHSSELSSQRVSMTLDGWSELTKKIDFVRDLVEAGAKYIGLGGSMVEEDLEGKSYVLYFTQHAKSAEPEKWNGNRRLFFQEMKKKREGHRYYAVDCDIHPTLMVENMSSCVQVLQAGKLIITDLLSEKKKWEQQKNNSLPEILEILRPVREMNILIVGGTRVGKSTWINEFISLLTYGSLEEAENGQLFTLVPSRFTVFDENGDERIVNTDPGNGHLQQTAQSTSQDAKVFSFNIDKTTVRLIGTPGIVETSGSEVVKKSFQNILETLAQFEEIHAICILLKPNAPLRFCVKELLHYLHRDAIRNIMFCFTNSRGASYRPCDTMPALKKLLQEGSQVEIPVTRSSVYCFDSESYRYLAAVKNTPPVYFTENDRKNFSNSWEKSAAETKRMLEHIKGLNSHKFKYSLALNHSRELILKLAKTLTDMMYVDISKPLIEVFEEASRKLSCQEEFDGIEKVAIKFSYFVKHNTITPYNDDMVEQYLQNLIRENEAKLVGEQRNVTLFGLRQCLEAYLAHKRFLDKEAHSEHGGIAPHSLEDFVGLVAELKQFKHLGSTLRDSLASLAF